MQAMFNAVDPTQIPQEMTFLQLEFWILFSIAVAGKNAKVTEKKMKEFLTPSQAWNGLEITHPFETVRMYIEYETLDDELHRAALGKYILLNKAYREVVKLDLVKLRTEDPNNALARLMKVPGIGPKSARMILMYAFSHHANLWAPLDTHILHWLRDKGYDAPLATPKGKLYSYYEAIFLREARGRGKTARELDTEIWLKYSGYGEKK